MVEAQLLAIPVAKDIGRPRFYVFYKISDGCFSVLQLHCFTNVYQELCATIAWKWLLALLQKSPSALLEHHILWYVYMCAVWDMCAYAVRLGMLPETNQSEQTATSDHRVNMAHVVCMVHIVYEASCACVPLIASRCSFLFNAFHLLLAQWLLALLARIACLLCLLALLALLALIPLLGGIDC